MKNKITIFLLFVIIFSITIFAQDKKPLDHSVYAGWKDLAQSQISNNGKWISYEINPLRGDGNLFIIESENQKSESFQRAKNAIFSYNSSYLAFRLTAPFDSIRSLKIAKKKAEDLPKDSIAIYLLPDKKIKKLPNIKSFKVSEKNSDWLVVLFDKEPSSKKDKNKTEKDTAKTIKDTAKVGKDSLKAKKDSSKIKKEGTDFLIYNPVSGKEYKYQNVAEYSIAKQGSLVAFTSAVKDSVDTCMVFVFDTQKEKLEKIFYKTGFVKVPAIDEKGEQVSFLFSIDTGSAKVYNLFYWNKKNNQSVCIVDTMNPNLPKGYSISENFTPWFAENGQKLFFGSAPKPVTEPKDTLLPEEKATFDLWSWTDPILQPHQLKELPQEKKRNYLAVYHIEKKQMIQLADENMPNVGIIGKGNLNTALGSNDRPYRKYISWDQGYNDYYSVDLNTGKRKLLLQKYGSGGRLTPAGNYFIYYDVKDSSWYSISIDKGNKVNLTKKIPAIFYNKLNDVPDDPNPIGLAAFTKNDKDVLIYDDYDIWTCDLSGKNSPVNSTNGYGKKNKTQFRYIRLDREEEFIDFDKQILLKGFNENTKNESFWNMILKEKNDPARIIEEPFRFTNPIKAKDENKLIWQKGDFENYPELRLSSMDFKNPVVLSNTNPQQNNYLWGTVELVNWTDANGKDMKGLLYKPENFDSKKKYPMIVYFYERNADNLNAHYIPSPSRSVVNIPYFVSNGYLIFIPDISYYTGYPGPSAYDAIVSGTLAMVQKGFVDKEHMGIQGQSWGGYQVAYLVTRTNLFAAAGAGAPVSNMISAYGGIRWEQGLSRMFQYEKSQSRIGGTLWDKPFQFIENSPIFFVPRINTPLFITHNDNDGAVPWYQSIEFFTALRRLEKPAWFVNYNGDSHNLKGESWGNRVDLSIRLGQFFDHYLKNKPMPKWMKEGIPAVKKGKETGYEE